MTSYGPNPNKPYPNEQMKRVCFIKNVITNPAIEVGDTPITTTPTASSFSSSTSPITILSWATS